MHAHPTNVNLFPGTGNNVLTGEGSEEFRNNLFDRDQVIDLDINGSTGNDIIKGGLGNDSFRGNGGIDRLAGHGGDDTLDGGGNQDFIWGEAGNDRLIGGAGNDELDGGADFDTYVYGQGLFGDDIIRDGYGETLRIEFNRPDLNNVVSHIKRVRYVDSDGHDDGKDDLKIWVADGGGIVIDNFFENYQTAEIYNGATELGSIGPHNSWLITSHEGVNLTNIPDGRIALGPNTPLYPSAPTPPTPPTPPSNQVVLADGSTVRLGHNADGRLINIATGDTVALVSVEGNTVAESSSERLEFTITREGREWTSVQDLRWQVVRADGKAVIAGNDFYGELAGELRFRQDEIVKKISLQVRNDSFREGDEQFTVKITDPHGRDELLIAQPQLGTVIDDAGDRDTPTVENRAPYIALDVPDPLQTNEYLRPGEEIVLTDGFRIGDREADAIREGVIYLETDGRSVETNGFAFVVRNTATGAERAMHFNSNTGRGDYNPATEQVLLRTPHVGGQDVRFRIAAMDEHSAEGYAKGFKFFSGLHATENSAPTLTAQNITLDATTGETANLRDLIDFQDADGDGIAALEFRRLSGNGLEFSADRNGNGSVEELSGRIGTTNLDIDPLIDHAPTLADFRGTFQSNYGDKASTFSFRASDGVEWSPWVSATVTVEGFNPDFTPDLVFRGTGIVTSNSSTITNSLSLYSFVKNPEVSGHSTGITYINSGSGDDYVVTVPYRSTPHKEGGFGTKEASLVNINNKGIDTVIVGQGRIGQPLNEFSYQELDIAAPKWNNPALTPELHFDYLMTGNKVSVATVLEQATSISMADWNVRGNYLRIETDPGDVSLSYYSRYDRPVGDTATVSNSNLSRYSFTLPSGAREASDEVTFTLYRQERDYWGRRYEKVLEKETISIGKVIPEPDVTFTPGQQRIALADILEDIGVNYSRSDYIVLDASDAGGAHIDYGGRDSGQHTIYGRYINNASIERDAFNGDVDEIIDLTIKSYHGSVRLEDQIVVSSEVV